MTRLAGRATRFRAMLWAVPMSIRGLVLLVLAPTLGCADPPAAPPTTEVRETIGAAWAGCEEYVGDTCLFVVRDRAPSLRIWVDVPTSTPLDARFDGVAVEATGVAIDGGTRLKVDVPTGAQELVISGSGVLGRLTIAWHESHPEILAARKAAEVGAREDVCAALKRVPTRMSGLDQLEAKGLSTWCVEPGGELATFEDAAEIAAANGLRRGFARAAHAALYISLEQENDVERARGWLQRMSEHAEGAPELVVSTDFCRMLVFRREGMLSAALEAVTESARWAHRLGMDPEFLANGELRATLLAELGRATESRALASELTAAAATQTNPCDRARILNNATWTHQVLAEAGLEHDPPLDRMLEEVDIHETRACDRHRDRVIARINVATAALSEHEVELARAWLDRLQVEDRASTSDDLRAQIDHLALGVALAENRWDDVSFPLVTPVPTVGDPRLRWHATVREAEVLERFGLESSAVDAWRRAEAILDENAASVGVSGGRESFISGRTASVIGLVEALVRRGDLDQAMCRARIARGRALRRAVRTHTSGAAEDMAAFDEFLRERDELERDAAADWSYAGDELTRRRARRDERRRQAMAALAEALPDAAGESDCAALRPRGERELLLLVLPTREDTLVLAAGPGGTQVERLPAIPEDEAHRDRWAEELLARVTGSLQDVALVRVLPVGRAWRLPLHATAFAGAPLVERVAVVYGLDLPVGRSLDRARTQALVVADPTGDLPHATNEGERVRVLLQAQSIDTDVLTGSAALREDVLARIASADLFHYSGHGEHRGVDGWDDALLLHDHASIESADVLALPHSPRTVVLAGCDTGAVNAGLFDGGMSLGRAFLLAGSDAVVVGDRKVDDAVTETFAVALYEESPQRMLDTPELAVRDALLETAASGVPVPAWSGFRLLVR